MTGSRLPLDGVKVVDFGDAWSSPFACTMLADAGADVIRIEDIHRQLSTLRGPVWPKDPADGYPDRKAGEHPWNRYYLMNNSERNKKGITLDLTQPTARRAFDALVARADIFATNYTPRATSQLGLTFDDLRSINPRIVYAHVTGYGCEGDMADTVALGSSIDAWTGHMGLRGYPETTPYDTAQSYIADSAGSMMLAFALLAALEERDITGEAQCIELALSEVLLQYLAAPILHAVVTGDDPVPHGNRSLEWAPQGAYQCEGDDRWLTLAARSDSEWSSLCQILGFDASLYPSMQDRMSSQDEIDRLLQAAIRPRGGRPLMDELQSVGVPAMFVYRDSEILAQPQLTGGDFLQTAHHAETGTRIYPGPVWNSTNYPMELRSPHFGLGEHNYQVLCEELGFSDAEYQQLLDDEAIGTGYSFWP